MIADDFFYTLFNSESRLTRIDALGKRFDLFSFMVGDIAADYELLYYRDGHLIRKRVVTDPSRPGGLIEEDLGEPLLSEPTRREAISALRPLWRTAALLGIKTEYAPTDLRTYVPRELTRAE